MKEACSEGVVILYDMLNNLIQVLKALKDSVFKDSVELVLDRG